MVLGLLLRGQTLGNKVHECMNQTSDLRQNRLIVSQDPTFDLCKKPEAINNNTCNEAYNYKASPNKPPKRLPSYCDRIIYRPDSNNFLQNNKDSLNYKSFYNDGAIAESDHTAVYNDVVIRVP